MREARYPAARGAARRLESYFAREAPAAGALAPDAAAIEALVDAAFWASLQREEGYAPEISLAFLPPEQAVRPLRLAPPQPLGPRALAQLSPAVERPGIHLGVWRVGDELLVWGTTRTVPPFCFVLEVVSPGLLVVKHRVRDDSAKFRNVAVFQGEEVKVLDREPALTSSDVPLLRPLLRTDSADGASSSLLLRLAVSMRAHKRGGTLLVVPAGSEAWRQSVVQPIGYAVAPAFTELGDLLAEAGADPDPDYAAIGRAVDALAGLTAVDGATLITDRFELLAFGVKIARTDGQLRVERVCLTEPIEGGRAVVLAPAPLGGTRHISAAQFANDQRDSLALVASQDGRFTVFAWCDREGMVHAHRIETLLY
jgi:sensor domain DACNV-containing protein